MFLAGKFREPSPGIRQWNLEKPLHKGPGETFSRLVFITPAGQRWVRVWTRGKPMGAHADLEILARVSRVDRVTSTMAQLLGKLGLARRGHTFYALRHTFETIAGESRDQVAVDAIMGHSREDMASVYRERIGDDRLQAVAEHVR